jgi:hypothetical protein
MLRGKKPAGGSLSGRPATLALLAAALGAATLCAAAARHAPAAWAHESAVPPPSAPMTVVGTLTCGLGAESQASQANPAAQGRDVVCRFRPGTHGAAETYVGKMQGVGKSRSLFAEGTVILAVKAPAATALAPGMLQQTYSTDAAPRSAAPPLVGDRNKAVVLQPLRVEEGRVAKGRLRPDAVIVLVELKLQASPA